MDQSNIPPDPPQASRDAAETGFRADFRAFSRDASAHDDPSVNWAAAFAWQPAIAEYAGFPVCSVCGFPHGKHAPDCDLRGRDVRNA